jgi:hypothetical protein
VRHLYRQAACWFPVPLWLMCACLRAMMMVPWPEALALGDHVFQRGSARLAVNVNHVNHTWTNQKTAESQPSRKRCKRQRVRHRSAATGFSVDWWRTAEISLRGCTVSRFSSP